MEVMCATGDPVEAEKLIGWRSPDVALIDLGLPDPESGVRLARKVSWLSGLSVIVLTAHTEPYYRHLSHRAGAAAFVPKDVGFDDLIDVVHSVAANEKVPERFDPSKYSLRLSERERRVLIEAAKGGNLAQVSREFLVAPRNDHQDST